MGLLKSETMLSCKKKTHSAVVYYYLQHLFYVLHVIPRRDSTMNPQAALALRPLSGSRYVITVNNYGTHGHLTEEQVIVKLTADNVVYGVYGREVAPTTGTRHLQVFVIFNRARRVSAVRREWRGCHCELARGTSAQCRDYSKKDGDWEEFGTFPSQQGARNDLTLAFAWADEFVRREGRYPRSPEIAQELPHVYVRNPRFSAAVRLRAGGVRLFDGDVQLREWQRELLERLQQPADDRTIIFVVDRDGNSGKSWFCRYMMQEHFNETQVLSSGRKVDLAHLLDDSKRLFLFNLARGGLEFLPLQLLEEIKDRIVISTKYVPVTKYFVRQPHVVVFCNEMFNNINEDGTEKLTGDRVEIIELS